VCSLIPAADEPHKVLAVAKVVGLTVVLLAAGVFIFGWGKAKAARSVA
jgi:hypothetical protein